MQPETYKTIASLSVAEFKDRGSRFIAYARPVKSVDEFERWLSELKTEHPKAVHHCYAYRLGFDKNTWRANDDGEPSGSAGRPILGQIDSFQLTQAGIVVVRYFGGVLLGVPGLIHAYKTAAKLALEQAVITEKSIEKDIRILCAYDHHFKVLNFLKRYQLTFTIQIRENQVIIDTAVPLSLSGMLEKDVKEFAIIEAR